MIVIIQKTVKQKNELETSNTYLQRGKGKISGDVKRRHFYAFYKKNAKEKLVDEKSYKSFLTELLNIFSENIITEGLELKINQLGKLRIKSDKMHFFKKNGERSKSLRPNWEKTWEYWFTKYPSLSRQEIVDIKGKIVIYHDNEHTDGEYYEHFWDKTKSVVSNKLLYDFKASRQFSRLLAKTVKNVNRKVYYYG